MRIGLSVGANSRTDGSYTIVGLEVGDRKGDSRAIVRADAPVTGKVGIATGGGSGHLPLFTGYVGNAGNKDWGLGMMKGTSPSIAATSDGVSSCSG